MDTNILSMLTVFIYSQLPDRVTNVYLYCEDPGLGGLAKHLVYLRAMVRLAHQLGATLIIEEDYSLLEYIDVDVVRANVPIDSVFALNDKYSWELLAQGLGCCTKSCSR